MFRYAKNVRLASLRRSLALSGSYWISPCLSLALYGSLWLPLWLSLALTATLWHTLALSGSLLLSNFAYTVLDRLSGPLLGSQLHCHADALSPALIRTKKVNDNHDFIIQCNQNWTPTPQFLTNIFSSGYFITLLLWQGLLCRSGWIRISNSIWMWLNSMAGPPRGWLEE